MLFPSLSLERSGDGYQNTFTRSTVEKKSFFLIETKHNLVERWTQSEGKKIRKRIID